MVSVLCIATYLSLSCFVFGSIRRIRQYAFLPLHLRWELYPVPHEAPSRVRHGGSYFEESEWWTKRRRFHPAGELRAMAAEILLFKSVWDSNKNLWWRSFSFHLGLYCICAFVGLKLLFLFSALAALAASTHAACTLLGRAGLALTLIGSVALLWRRMTDRESRDYTHPADYLHLAFIFLTSGILLLGTYGSVAPSPERLIRALASFDTGLRIPYDLGIGILLTLALVAYIPYSHMAHFIAKYFTFHSVRWDDAPAAGKKFNGPMERSLNYRPTWAASHVGADGKRTWTEIATANPTVKQEVAR